MKGLPPILFLGLFAICSCRRQDHKINRNNIDSSVKASLTEAKSKKGTNSDRYADSAMTIVEKLPEVKNLLIRFNKENSDTSHRLSLNVAMRPEKDFKYYWIEVGEITPDHFVTYENFYVGRKDFIVYYYDTALDSVMPIDQWRKSGKDTLCEVK